MEMQLLENELSGCAYPGRGIVIGKSEDGTKAVTAYFIMGRSANPPAATEYLSRMEKESVHRHLMRASLKIQALSSMHL